MSLSDPRLVLARGGVAAAGLEGQVQASCFLPVVARVCRAERANLRAEPRPDAEQVNQLLFGERFEMLEEEGGWALGRAARDGYVGYVESAALAAPWGEPTHWVRALRTYAFPEADLKSAPARLLPMNALVRATARSGRYLHAEGAGWITDSHLAELTSVELDPAGVAERYLEAPYLWGGRDSLGLDCSGLVQAAFYACGLPCPRDSDMQESLGAAIEAPELRRNDLIFWTGHVALMLDEARLIHANGHHMATTVEPLEEAIARIEEAGFGPPIACRRVL